MQTVEVNRIRDIANRRRREILTAADKPGRSAVRFDGIPEDLKAEQRWVCWTWHLDDREKWTKKPVRPNNRSASSTNPKTWSSFTEVCRAYKRDPSISGVGFVLGDGFAGIDLDCCLDEDQLCQPAAQIVAGLNSYTEISPTGTGVKIFFRGQKPKSFSNSDEVEIYDHGRYFTITGDRFGDSDEIRDCLWSVLDENHTDEPSDQYRHAINSMRKIPVDASEMDGSKRLVQYARQAVRCGLDSVDAVEAIADMLSERPTPKQWTDDEILQRVDQAARKLASETKSHRLTLTDLLSQNPDRRPELIEGLLRRGEVMNVIAASKQGKSWLMYSLALSVSASIPWLGHEVTPGKVLVVDNELHISELAYRMRRATDTLVLDPAEIESRLMFEPMRGSWPTINEVDAMLDRHYADDDLSLIILDAYYRLLPAGVSENDNAAVTAIFNQLDRIAARHNCSIALVHHASKGDQSGKSITDVGSGAGALTRAADTHVIIRPHEDDAYAVMEAVCRSHEPLEPKTLRFEFPTWRVESDIRPEVKVAKTEADRRQVARDNEADEAVLKCLAEEVEATMSEIRKKTGLSYDRCNRVLARLQDQDRVQITKEVKVRGNLTQVWAILDPLGEL